MNVRDLSATSAIVYFFGSIFDCAAPVVRRWRRSFATVAIDAAPMFPIPHVIAAMGSFLADTHSEQRFDRVGQDLVQ
jgi:hypothetical protein